MTFRLPRLPNAQPPWASFQLWWQRVVETLEKQENAQDETIKRIRRLLSHTVPTTILSAVDTGSSVDITILNHTRVYADATTLAVTGKTVHGLLNNTWYGCYYDDITLADMTPNFIFTTSLDDAQAATTAGRHFCGFILTPAAASGATVESGGAYPLGGATVGGELF